jgi:hypothetical protein
MKEKRRKNLKDFCQMLVRSISRKRTKERRNGNEIIREKGNQECKVEIKEEET